MDYYKNLIVEGENKYYGAPLAAMALGCKNFYLESISKAEKEALADFEEVRKEFNQAYQENPFYSSEKEGRNLLRDLKISYHRHKVLASKKEETEKIDTISFIKKFGVDKEEQRLEDDENQYAELIMKSSSQTTYNPMIFSHSMLISTLKAREEWRSMSDDEKLVAKLFVAISNIDKPEEEIDADYLTLFNNHFSPSDRSLLESYEEDKHTFDVVMAVHRAKEDLSGVKGTIKTAELAKNLENVEKATESTISQEEGSVQD